MKIFIFFLVTIIAVLLAAGIWFLATAGMQESDALASGLATEKARTDAITARMAELEGKISSLNSELESCRLLIEANRNRTNQVSDALNADLKSRQEGAVAAVKKPDSVPAEGIAPAAMPDAVETIKEMVKQELKEERKAKEIEDRTKWFQNMKETEQKKWKKKIEEEFPAFAKEIKLSPTQEFAIRDIAENGFRQLMELMEETFTKPPEEIDWAVYEEKTGNIFKEAERQIVEMVSEEQANAIRKFFEAPGR